MQRNEEERTYMFSCITFLSLLFFIYFTQLNWFLLKKANELQEKGQVFLRACRFTRF